MNKAKETTVTINENNIVKLSGFVKSTPEYSHETCGEKFYQFTVSTPRQSGKKDVLPITISERLVDLNEIVIDRFVELEGNVRTYNKYTEGGNRLLIYVFAREIKLSTLGTKPELNDCVNSVKLEGFVCKKPKYRTTPLGREICDLLIAVNRPYGKSDYIPVITWGRNARFSNNFEVSQKLVLHGRLQSRTYLKKLDKEGMQTEERVAYELSVSKFEEVESE